MQSQNNIRLIVAVTGASGAIYSVRFLRAIASLCTGHVAFIMSPSAIRVYVQEFGSKVKSPNEYLDEVLGQTKPDHLNFTIHDYQDIGAKPASGSANFQGMVIVPCSMKSLSAISIGYTSNLVERAADVCLKERRKLIVIPREAPYSLIHLKNMTALTEAGGIVLPASPGFYQNPRSFDDLGDFIAGRALSLLGIEHKLFSPWEG